MELKVVYDGHDVIKLVMVVSLERSHLMPDFQALDDLLGAGGYDRSVLLSLETLTFIDTGLVNWLLIAHKRLSYGGGRLVVHSLHPHVEDILKTLRFDRVLYIAEDETVARELLLAHREIA